MNDVMELLMIEEPYKASKVTDSQWLISMLELYLLEHGHTQQRVNAWILAQILNNPEQDTPNNE